MVRSRSEYTTSPGRMAGDRVIRRIDQRDPMPTCRALDMQTAALAVSQGTGHRRQKHPREHGDDGEITSEQLDEG